MMTVRSRSCDTGTARATQIATQAVAIAVAHLRMVTLPSNQTRDDPVNVDDSHALTGCDVDFLRLPRDSRLVVAEAN